MIQSYQETIETLASNSSPITFQTDCRRTRSATCCGWLQHNEGSPLYKILDGGDYRVTFNANVTAAATGSVAIGLYMDGVLLPGTTTIAQVTTAGDYTNVSINKVVPICCRGNATLTIQSVPSILSTLTPTATTTEAPIIQNANLTITRLNG